MAHVTMDEWILMMSQEMDKTKLRRERLMFDVATYVMERAIGHAKKNFGNNYNSRIGKSARNQGRSGAMRRSIKLARVNDSRIVVTAGDPGVPYAPIQELGGIIVPRVAGALTVPLLDKYIGKRAREFKDLHILKTKKGAFLQNSSGDLAYMLLKRVTIPPRPFLRPAAEDLRNNAVMSARIKVLFGTSKLPYEVIVI